MYIQIVIMTGSSILALFFDILELIHFRFFLEFEIMLRIIHPILFVDLLEHSFFLHISGEVEVCVLLRLRHRRNDVFETLFVGLIKRIDLQSELGLLRSLEIVLSGLFAVVAALLTQRVLRVARGRDDMPLLLFRSRSGIALCLGYVVEYAHCSGIRKV